MTKPEVLLWLHLRDRPAGYRFRRQHPLGPYVLDFYCPSAKLAIEVDGMAHEMGNRPKRDRHRDDWLAEKGVRTLRIPAADVLRDLDTTIRHIVATCATPLHQPAAGPPPHAARREESAKILPIADGEGDRREAVGEGPAMHQKTLTPASKPR